MKQKATELAYNRWPDILMENGLTEKDLSGKHGPCPMCGGKDRFRWIKSTEKGRYVCNQCTPDGADGMALLINITGKPFRDLAEMIEEKNCDYDEVKPVKKANPVYRLKRIASGCVPITENDPVGKYLLSRSLKIHRTNLRINHKVDYYSNGIKAGVFPAMVAKIQNHKGERESYHITYLSYDGTKAKFDDAKKVLPPVNTIRGCGIYLAPLESHMLIAEGIETAIAGHTLFGIPPIATISSSGMESIILPEIIDTVTILADKDKSFTGQAAAFNLAKRLVSEGKNVSVKIPGIHGDFADVLELNR